MNQPAAILAAEFEKQAGWCQRLGSPFYHALCLRISGNVANSGICWRVLESRANDPQWRHLPNRFLSGVHRLVLSGELTALARHYPSTGGDGDSDAAFESLLPALELYADRISASVPEIVQTNEVNRCCALLPGFLEFARRTRLPLSLLEIGSSAGLNLRWDCYRYETSRGAWGPADSPLTFREPFANGAPDFDGDVRVAERRGCDLNPIDPTSEDGRVSLLSFLWPDQPDRFQRLRGALQVARQVPAAVDRADAIGWLQNQLAQPRPGAATVVFHSVIWPYLRSEQREGLSQILTSAGERAAPNAPLAWLTMEPEENDDGVHLTVWPGGVREKVASAGPHAGSVTVLRSQHEARG